MPRRSLSDAPVITLRELNRALLARQMLVRRERVGAVPAIERLAALQAQWPKAPYVGLWSRLEGFERADLERALRARAVVKASLMRGTLHLASARDYPYYAVAAREARRLLWHSTQRQIVTFYKRDLDGVRAFARAGRSAIAEPEKLHAAMLRHAETPRSREELVAFMERRARIPHELAQHLVWNFIAAHGMLVHVPESALFETVRAGDLVAASVALPRLRSPAFDDAVRHTVTRYLAAFGPATVEDVASWTSIRTPAIRDALSALGPRVARFRDERGRPLYDLIASPRPPADVPAPPRFLPKWDSTLLAYTPGERIRILPASHHRAVIGKNGDVAQTVLIDGTVAGTWSLERRSSAAVIAIGAFRRLARGDRSALEREGEGLARFLAPEARAVAVKIT